VAQRVHWDSEYAKSVGVPSAYDYGMMRDCWLSHFLTDWMGDDAWLVKLSSQMRKFNYIGDSHVITGEVVGKRRENDMYLVDIEFRGTSQRGEITCPATATIALPSREAKSVTLPAAPAELERTAAQMLARHEELKSR
jgi:acyl dehydratase